MRGWSKSGSLGSGYGEDYGTHSLRRTKASIIYKATGNLRAVQLLLGHSKIESTVRYLGVDVEDALTLAERTMCDQYVGFTAIWVRAGRPFPTQARRSAIKPLFPKADIGPHGHRISKPT